MPGLEEAVEGDGAREVTGGGTGGVVCLGYVVEG